MNLDIVANYRLIKGDVVAVTYQGNLITVHNKNGTDHPGNAI